MTEIELLTPTKIIRSKRKSICLTINLNGDFFVRAPLRSSDSDIFKFITQKAEWIITKRTQHILNRRFVPLEVVSGETIQIFGEIYELKLQENNITKIENNILYLPQNNAKNKLIIFLKNNLKRYLNIRVNELSLVFNLPYKSYSISSAKTNWGSCSFSNKLHFSYKLAMCPKSIIDYIILHELTHTKIKNHSKQFYAFISNILPNYKQCEKWLKDNKEIITVI